MFLMRCKENKEIVGTVKCHPDNLFDAVDSRVDPFAFEYMVIASGNGLRWTDKSPTGWLRFEGSGVSPVLREVLDK